MCEWSASNHPKWSTPSAVVYIKSVPHHEAWSTPSAVVYTKSGPSHQAWSTPLPGDNTAFYRRPIRKFDFTKQDGKEKWTAYNFTKNIYDTWMSTYLENDMFGY
jgi:hypothetical protein